MVAGGRVAAFGIAVGHVVADFELGCGQAGKAAAVESVSFETAPKRFDVGVVVAVAAPALALSSPVAGKQLLEAGGHVLAARSECTVSPAEGQRTAKGRRNASLTRSSGMAARTSQPATLHEQRSGQTAG